jgi:Uncharacterized protein conserved in bacteria (DUF2325)
MRENKEVASGAALAGWTFGRRDKCCAKDVAAAPASAILPVSSVSSVLPVAITAPVAADEATGSRRRRLWELGSHAHCPVIGVCLPLAALRRLARKVLGSEPIAYDYALHCGMVTDCKRRTAMAEAVQRELDRRFMLHLRRAAAAKTEASLAAWWQEQGACKDLPGALWATLTHPRCTTVIEHHVLGQVHMIQHQVGMATRVELARFEALIDENAVLARELAKAQRRSTLQAAEHAECKDAMQADLLRLRGQEIAALSAAALLREDLLAMRQAVPELEGRLLLTKRHTQQAERIVDLQRALHQAHADVERLHHQLNAAVPAPVVASTDARGSAPASQPPALQPPRHRAGAMALVDRAVLCVGGRTASVPVYRRLVESQGARFLHHDGGEEHSASLLESTLAAADLVICQAGCISHNAYWRVKDHCKRTGKRCVFVETPSATSLQRALADIGSAP